MYVNINQQTLWSQRSLGSVGDGQCAAVGGQPIPGAHRRMLQAQIDANGRAPRPHTDIGTSRCLLRLSVPQRPNIGTGLGVQGACSGTWPRAAATCRQQHRGQIQALTATSIRTYRRRHLASALRCAAFQRTTQSTGERSARGQLCLFFSPCS